MQNDLVKKKRLTLIESRRRRSISSVPPAWLERVGSTASVFESFFHAYKGFKRAFSRERNLRIHLFAAVAVILLGSILHIEMLQWALLILVCSLVISLELLNTALERAVNLLTEGKYNIYARDAKDIAAAAVAFSAIGAILVALCIFGPRIYSLMSAWL